MTTYTYEQIGIDALRDVGFLGEDESPTSAASEEAETLVSKSIAFLAANGVNFINLGVDVVPEEYALVLAEYVGAILSKRNGRIDQATEEGLKEAAKNRMLKISAAPATGSIAENDYY